MFFVYMVRCADGTLYTGLARDPDTRVRIHNAGKGAKYTRSRLPVVRVYLEACESLSAALKRERQIKPWSRAQKEALIAGQLSVTCPIDAPVRCTDGRPSAARRQRAKPDD